MVFLGKGASRKVHRLVLEAFVGPCPPGMECCHNDGNPLNNRLDNLRWDTRRSNQLDRNRHGTGSRGEKSTVSRLLECEVREIKRGLRCGESYRQLAAVFGVSYGAVSAIKYGKSWAWLEEN
jgi:hypothetical protein